MFNGKIETQNQFGKSSKVFFLVAMIKKTQNTVNVGKIIMKIPSTISKYATPLVKLKHFCKKKTHKLRHNLFLSKHLFTLERTNATRKLGREV